MQRTLKRIAAVLLHPVALLLLGCLFVGAIRYFDTRWLLIPYVCLATLAIASIFFVLSRRIGFALYAAALIVLVLSAASEVKFALKGFSLHVFDFAFTGLDASALSFLAGSYGYLLYGGIACLAAAAILLTFLYRFGKPRALGLHWRLAASAAAIGATVAAYPLKPGQPSYLYFITGYDASAFFVSLGDINFPLGKIHLVDVVEAATPAGRLLNDADCGGIGDRPDIIYILSESQTDPANFPQVRLPAKVRDSYLSDDGRVHPMYVETFGGGTWVTNFSIMTGLSAADFGWQSPYVTQMMESRVKASFPELLARCGYRTVTIMPMDSGFVNEGPFLRSLGFQEIIDYTKMAPENHFVRDSYYFDVAEKLIREHRKTDKRPLFLSIQTLYPHGPYNRKLTDTADMSGGPYADDAEADEYFRRVMLSRQDLDAFLTSREQDSGPSGTVVLDYGDHQAAATKPYLPGKGEDGSLFADMHSEAYKTYFAVHGYGRPLDMRPLALPMDVGFVTASMIEAAGLPSSPVFRSLARIRDACGGRYHECRERQLVDVHLRQRADAGLLELN